jgi:hypothetical protein
MNFGNGAVPSIYSKSYTILPSSFQAHIFLVRHWDEAWRKFVNIAQSGLAGMATGTAGERLATRGVSHSDSFGSNISLILKRLSSTHPRMHQLALFFLLQGYCSTAALPHCCLVFSPTHYMR